MSVRERTVLHVLPHPGGGGETYVDALLRMDGYRFERAYVAEGPDPSGARLSIARRTLALQREALAFDLVHVVGEMASALCLPVLAAKPSIVSPQGLSLVRRLHGGRRKAALANVRLMARAATRIICSSETECLDVVALGGRAAERKAVVVRNGVAPVEPIDDDSRATLRRDLGLTRAGTVGAWVGALDTNKDPMTPIRALHSLRGKGENVYLLLVGDGPLRAQVARAALDGEGGAVRVLGLRSDVDRILGASDFFVLSSQREGLSFALLEAMARGLAPVVSDAPANVEAVGDTGIVVPAGDVERFAQAFARLARDPQARQTLGSRARGRVAQSFSADEMVRNTRAVYDEIGRLR